MSRVTTYERHTMSKLSHLSGLSLIGCLAAGAVFGQDNSFAVTIQNNAMMQANLTRQMINLGGTPAGPRPFSPANCMPPADLQRGPDAHVPPELQRDPRYQEYLRCKQGIPPGSQGGLAPQTQPPAQSTQHLPINATDFVPARPGHPVVDQIIGNLSFTPEQRQQLHMGSDEAFRRIAAQYRPNNLAVSVAVAYTLSMSTLNGSRPDPNREFVYSVNDQLAQSPKFALLTAQEKQDESDKLIFQSFIIAAARDRSARDPQAHQQAQELSRVVLRQFDNDGGASMLPKNRVALGVRIGPVTREIAAEAGFQGTDGALVIEVSPGSHAERAGIKPGDILVRLGDQEIKTSADVPSAIASVSRGTEVLVQVFRQGAQSNVRVVF